MQNGRSDRTIALRIIGVVVLVPVVIVAAIAFWLYQSFGGHGYQPTDYEVRAARIRADSTEAKDIDTIVTQLSPMVGGPAMRAVVDYCWDTAEAWTFQNDIACARIYYLYYPLATPTMPSDVGTVSWPSSSASHAVYVDRAAEAAYTSRQTGLADLAEMDGYRELMLAATSTHSMVVTYSVTYFQG
jgi:hypothetical protein